MDKQKLTEWSKQIHENACKHGWHDEKKSDAHWLCMVMTEIAEAVEADRKNRRAAVLFYDLYRENIDGTPATDEQFKTAYDAYIKGSVEEEFADIVIRLLDFAYEKYGDNMEWREWCVRDLSSKTSFTEKAFSLLRWMTYEDIGMSDITLFVQYMYQWAYIMNVNLNFHIEAKMRYNAMRPYRHGCKAY